MSDETFFDKVYKTRDADALLDVYADWAGQYDADLVAAGYRTPARVAEALKGVLSDLSGPTLDYGCGTGLSGKALRTAGFPAPDGCDPSEEMLEQARASGAYASLWSFDLDAPPAPEILGRYANIVATGVVSVGAAPPEVLSHLWAGLASGARLAFSYNAHTLEDPAYMEALDRARANAIVEAEEDGPHVERLGSTSRVFVFRAP